MKTWMNAAAITLFVSATAAPCVSAQETEQRSVSLARYVVDDVRISTTNGTIVDAAMASIRDGQVDVLTGNGTFSVPLDTIARIDRRGDSTKNGFIIGAVIGAVATLVLCGECAGGWRIYDAVGSAFFFGFIGAGFDAMHDGWTTIYARKSDSARRAMGNSTTFASVRIRF